MLRFIRRDQLKKDDLKGIAALMYGDVSMNSWDQENLTKRNLDWSIESVRIIDKYTKRLVNAEYKTNLLDDYFDNFVVRLGAYVGEVIRRNLNQDFHWYEAESVYRYSSHLSVHNRDKKIETVLYSKKKDAIIDPLSVVLQFLRGNSPYPDFLRYVEETIDQYS
ncbi:MAG: hypothetical protein ACQEUT_15915 [Bacillota bacterium]